MIWSKPNDSIKTSDQAGLCLKTLYFWHIFHSSEELQYSGCRPRNALVYRARNHITNTTLLPQTSLAYDDIFERLESTYPSFHLGLKLESSSKTSIHPLLLEKTLWTRPGWSAEIFREDSDVVASLLGLLSRLCDGA